MEESNNLVGSKLGRVNLRSSGINESKVPPEIFLNPTIKEPLILTSIWGGGLLKPTHMKTNLASEPFCPECWWGKK